MALSHRYSSRETRHGAGCGVVLGGKDKVFQLLSFARKSTGCKKAPRKRRAPQFINNTAQKQKKKQGRTNRQVGRQILLLLNA